MVEESSPDIHSVNRSAPARDSINDEVSLRDIAAAIRQIAITKQKIAFRSVSEMCSEQQARDPSAPIPVPSEKD
jgi:hypothetical protein